MTDQLVYPALERQELFREITSETNLQWDGKRLFYAPKEVQKKILEGRFLLGGDTLDDLTEEEVLEHFNEEGGVNYCHVFRNGGLRMTLADKSPQEYTNLPTAFETILFGCGVLRPIFGEPMPFDSAMEMLDGNDVYPTERIHSENLSISGNYLHVWVCQRRTGNETNREAWESTNIVYGDSYGELEQLMRRRNSRQFLDRYLQLLQEATSKRTLKKNDMYGKPLDTSYEIFAGICDRKGDDSRLHEIWLRHIDETKRWDKAPKSRKELLQRVEELLENTIIDKSAYEKVLNRVLYKADGTPS